MKTDETASRALRPPALEELKECDICSPLHTAPAAHWLRYFGIIAG